MIKKLIIFIVILLATFALLFGPIPDFEPPIVITEDNQLLMRVGAGEVTLPLLQSIADQISCSVPEIYYVYGEANGEIYATITNIIGTTTPFVVKICSPVIEEPPINVGGPELTDDEKLTNYASSTSCKVKRYIYVQSGQVYDKDVNPGATTTKIVTIC